MRETRKTVPPCHQEEFIELYDKNIDGEKGAEDSSTTIGRGCAGGAAERRTGAGIA